MSMQLDWILFTCMAGVFLPLYIYILWLECFFHFFSISMRSNGSYVTLITKAPTKSMSFKNVQGDPGDPTSRKKKQRRSTTSWLHTKDWIWWLWSYGCHWYRWKSWMFGTWTCDLELQLNGWSSVGWVGDGLSYEIGNGYIEFATKMAY